MSLPPVLLTHLLVAKSLQAVAASTSFYLLYVIVIIFCIGSSSSVSVKYFWVFLFFVFAFFLGKCEILTLPELPFLGLSLY